MEKAHLGLLHPFSGLSILAELDVGKVVEVLGAMEIFEHLSAIREGCLHRIPDPAGSVPDETKAHLVQGDKSLLFDMLRVGGKLGLVADLMPTEKVHNLFPVKQVAANTLDLFPAVGNSLFLGSNGSHGTVGGKDKNRFSVLIGRDLFDNLPDFSWRRNDLDHVHTGGDLAREMMDGVG